MCSSQRPENWTPLKEVSHSPALPSQSVISLNALKSHTLSNKEYQSQSGRDENVMTDENNIKNSPYTDHIIKRLPHPQYPAKFPGQFDEFRYPSIQAPIASSSAGCTKCDVSRTAFLDLPREIRDIVYCLYFRTKYEIAIHLNSSFPGKVGIVANMPVADYSSRVTQLGTQTGVTTALLFVNRFIYNEGYRALCAHNCFMVLGTRSWRTRYHSEWHNIPKILTTNISNLQIRDRGLIRDLTSGRSDKTSTAWTATFQKFTSLQILVLLELAPKEVGQLLSEISRKIINISEDTNVQVRVRTAGQNVTLITGHDLDYTENFTARPSHFKLPSINKLILQTSVKWMKPVGFEEITFPDLPLVKLRECQLQDQTWQHEYELRPCAVIQA